MDLKRAFDSIYHDVLLQVLTTNGIRGIALDILKSFLTNRTQCVRINNVISSPLPVTRGVIQGSIIGPLLFLLVINHLCSLPLKGQIILYADDAVLLLPTKRTQDIATDVRNDMLLIMSLFHERKLILNEKKTVFMCFHSAYSANESEDRIRITDDFTLTKVPKFKYLGIWLDPTLKFSDHISHVESRVAPAVGVLWKIRNMIPIKLRILILNALVQPYLTYIIPLWGTASHRSLHVLQVLQNRAIRNVFGLDRLHNREVMYENYKILPLRALCIFRTAVFMFNTVNEISHSNVSFPSPKQKRTRLLMDVKCTNNRYGEKQIEVFGARLFNWLPMHIIKSSSLHKFKENLHQHLLNPTQLKSMFEKKFLEIFKPYKF